MEGASHRYEVEAKPAAGGWRVIKRPNGGSGGLVIGEYKHTERPAADEVAGLLNALRDKEVGQ
ncbi:MULTISPECIES: hypothetical protein [Streptomyces]|uniref:DUF2188 domain-containing protein n=2 Tax=Streptomyces TaxID=1883 RepID=A0ABV9ISR8_9ACTN